MNKQLSLALLLSIFLFSTPCIAMQEGRSYAECTLYGSPKFPRTFQLSPDQSARINSFELSTYRKTAKKSLLPVIEQLRASSALWDQQGQDQRQCAEQAELAGDLLIALNNKLSLHMMEKQEPWEHEETEQESIRLKRLAGDIFLTYGKKTMMQTLYFVPFTFLPGQKKQI